MGHADRWRRAALIGAAAGLVAVPPLGGALFVLVLAWSARVREGVGERLALATAAALVLISLATSPTVPSVLLAVGLAAFAPLTSWWSSVARSDDAESSAIGFVIGAGAHLFAAIGTAQGGPIAGLTAHPNVLGAVAALAVPSVVALALGRRRGTWWRWSGVLVLLGVVAATGSRGATVAALVGAAWVVIHAAQAARSAAPWRRGRLWIGLGGVVALGAVLALWVGVRQPSVDEALGLTGRSTLWGIAVELVAERPVLGHGPGAWERLAERTEPSVSADRFPHAHSGYLEVAMTYGLVGVAVVVAFFASVFDALGRRRVGVWSVAARATWVVFAIVNVGDTFVIDARFLAIMVLVSGAVWARVDSHQSAAPLTPPAPIPPPPTA